MISGWPEWQVLTAEQKDKDTAKDMKNKNKIKNLNLKNKILVVYLVIFK